MKGTYPGPVLFLKAVRDHAWGTPHERAQVLAFCSALLLRADNGSGKVNWCSSERLADESGVRAHNHGTLKDKLKAAGFLDYRSVPVERPRNGRRYKTHAHVYELRVPDRAAETAVSKPHRAADPDTNRTADSAPISNPLSDQVVVAAVLETLSGLPKWAARPPDQDAGWLAELERDFPDVDLLDEAKGYAAYVADHPRRTTWNHRNGFRNRLKKAREFQARVSPRPGCRGEQDVTKPDPLAGCPTM
jgi:hypothetical protein